MSHAVSICSQARELVAAPCEAPRHDKSSPPVSPTHERTILSHTLTIKTQVRDPVAIRAACQRLKLPEPVHGATTLFAGEATGWQVRLPDWRYPIVCNTATGQLQLDNYGGQWGDPAHLDKFLQSYAVEKASLEARRQGYAVTEQALADGSIRLMVGVHSS